MGLLCVGIVVVAIALPFILYKITVNDNSVRWLFLIIAVFPILWFGGMNPSTDNYPYQAHVKFNGSNESVCFKSFEQVGNTITIDEYTTFNLHWTDFKRYDVHKSTLTIYLTDNDNKFVYEDREPKTTFNQPKDVATQ